LGQAGRVDGLLWHRPPRCSPSSSAAWIQAVIVMLTVAFIAFMLFQYVGDPVTNLLGQDATPEQRDKLRADLGLDQPFRCSSRLRRQRGAGRVRPEPAPGAQGVALIAERLPATLELA
jgi:peptide/nickel transport system permease protein